MVSAVTTGVSRRRARPSFSLVPTNRTTTGRSRFTLSIALRRPCATSSQRVIPPNTLMRIALTPLSMRISSKAFWTTSALAPPPISRKFAASPPSALIASIVAITRPAPFPITPISPLSFTYVSLLLLASCSKGSSPSASQRPPYPGCLKRALSSKVILASAATTFPSFVSMRGLISASSASSSTNKRNKEEKYPPT